MRKVKKGSGIYSYLNELGLLERGTDEELKNAKKVYWNNYKKQNKKENRKEDKSLKIFFNKKEYKIISIGAAKQRTSKTNFIKQSAITCQIISSVIVGEIRESLVLHHNTLLLLIEEKIISEEHGNQLVNQISEIEKRVLNYFHN